MISFILSVVDNSPGSRTEHNKKFFICLLFFFNCSLTKVRKTNINTPPPPNGKINNKKKLYTRLCSGAIIKNLNDFLMTLNAFTISYIKQETH